LIFALPGKSREIIEFGERDEKAPEVFLPEG
jgi:hypothetical protein